MRASSAALMHFNSIKVRLKLEHLGVDERLFRRFQFHKGTIKTIIGSSYIYEAPTFQFHKGTIKTNTSFARASSLNFDFNSIKVRLKRLCVSLGTLEIVFQFHKGTIKTRYSCIITR